MGEWVGSGYGLWKAPLTAAVRGTSRVQFADEGYRSDSPDDNFDAALYTPHKLHARATAPSARLAVATVATVAVTLAAVLAVLAVSRHEQPGGFLLPILGSLAVVVTGYAMYARSWAHSLVSVSAEAALGTLRVAYRAKHSETYSLGDIGTPYWELHHPSILRWLWCGARVPRPTLCIPLRGDTAPLRIQPYTPPQAVIDTALCDILRYYRQTLQPTEIVSLRLPLMPCAARPAAPRPDFP